ncbi:hypothetical protein P43SY_006968 [Pythium insidiosum]|uniref:3-oxo-5-alpha-steroid 4-dehydrogenase C-terminal domain-containing protein n=1 Tax=Pythium insidiosum TaxID=114742 RepID=A0AAD5M8X2_PYTIN|nr:hypothetical protein P43SY_006968 [Pythium insidiosum]
MMEANALFLGMWAAMAVLMIGTLFSDLLRALLVHGKVRQDTSFSCRWSDSLLRLEMRKSGWTWFYLAGTIYNLAIAAALTLWPTHPLVQTALRWLQHATGEDTALVRIRDDVVLVIGLLGIQDLRRFLESVLVTEFGDSTMHVARLIHYLGIAPSSLSDPASTDRSAALVSIDSPALWIGLLLFALGSFHQWKCNASLAKQKRDNGYRHVIPRGGWFDAVRCPLYSAELLIYLAFVVITGGQHTMVIVVFLWVLLNQSICAKYQSDWYELKFRGEELVRWVLVPGIW